MYTTLAILNRGILEKKHNVLLPFSNKALIIVNILYKQGYISNYIVTFNKIKVYFNIYQHNLIFNKLKFYKHLNSRKYVTYKQLKRFVFLNKKRLILTTVVGIVTSEVALKYKVGGCILAELI